MNSTSDFFEREISKLAKAVDSFIASLCLNTTSLPSQINVKKFYKEVHSLFGLNENLFFLEEEENLMHELSSLPIEKLDMLSTFFNKMVLIENNKNMQLQNNLVAIQKTILQKTKTVRFLDYLPNK